MAGRLADLFTDAGLEEVTAATREAELRTAGEIVPYVVEACDDYEEAAWKGAALGAVAAAVLSSLAYWLGGAWGGSPWLWTTLPVVAGAAAGYLVASQPGPVVRWLSGDETLELRARRRALQAFVEEEVFATRDRTGILLFVAVLERKVVVLGDAGINSRVEPPEWDEIVARLTEGLRRGRAAAALAAAVRASGDLLARHGVERRPDDADELANEPRLRER